MMSAGKLLLPPSLSLSLSLSGRPQFEGLGELHCHAARIACLSSDQVFQLRWERRGKEGSFKRTGLASMA